MTPKQEAFAREYLIDLNATQGAIRAGYSEKTAKQQGARLLTNVDVAAGIAANMAERAAQTGMDAHWVLKRLEAEAEADLADLFNPDGSLRPVHEWPKIWRQGLVAGIDVASGSDGVRVDKVKLSDRVRRIELLGRHVDVQAFKDKVEHSVDEGLAEWLGQR